MKPVPRRRPRGCLVVALLLASGGCDTADRDRRAVAPPAASHPTTRAPAPSFDGARAMELVRRQVEFGPRIPGSEGHAAQLAWMVDTLRALADSVVVDEWRHRTRRGPTIPLANVRAVFLPDAGSPSRGERLLLLAHWDTRPISDGWSHEGADTVPVPGANDGASGVAVLMELARLLAERPPPVTVDVLLVDGEDYGSGDMYLGSRRFAERLPDGWRPKYGILLDMVGDADPRFPIEGFSARYAPDVARRVWEIAAELGYGPSFPVEVGPSIGDDHLAFNDAGIPTIDVIDFTYGGPDNPFWHTPEDVPEHVSAATLGMVGRVVAEVVYRGG